MMIITIKRAIILKVLPTELKFAIHFVGIDEMQPWISMIKVERRKVW